MALSTHDPVLTHRLSHTSRHMDHIPTYPAPFPLVLYHPHLSSSAWQQEHPIRPVHQPPHVVASTPRACLRAVPNRPRSV